MDHVRSLVMDQLPQCAECTLIPDRSHSNPKRSHLLDGIIMGGVLDHAVAARGQQRRLGGNYGLLTSRSLIRIVDDENL
jgi:hypothetical protein